MERAAAVSVFVEILTDWWTKHGREDRDDGAGTPSVKT